MCTQTYKLQCCHMKILNKTVTPILEFLCVSCFLGQIILQQGIHYENTPIQIYRKISPPKSENFQIKNSENFHISAQNIDCGYSLEPPRRGGSNEYDNICF